jgi:hypothetical protein
MVIIRQARYPIQKELIKVNTVCSAAVIGATLRGSFDRPIAAATFLTTAATVTVFELPGIFDYI